MTTTSFEVAVYQHGHAVARGSVEASSAIDAVRALFGLGVEVSEERPGVARVTDEDGRFCFVEYFASAT